MPKFKHLPPAVGACIAELHKIEEGDDMPYPFSLSDSLEWDIEDFDDLEDSERANFFEEEIEAFNDPSPIITEAYTTRERKVVYIRVLEGLYTFLVLGKNGAVAATYYDYEEKVTKYYSTYLDEEMQDRPPMITWLNVKFGDMY